MKFDPKVCLWCEPKQKDLPPENAEGERSIPTGWFKDLAPALWPGVREDLKDLSPFSPGSLGDQAWDKGAEALVGDGSLYVCFNPEANNGPKFGASFSVSPDWDNLLDSKFKVKLKYRGPNIEIDVWGEGNRDGEGRIGIGGHLDF